MGSVTEDGELLQKYIPNRGEGYNDRMFLREVELEPGRQKAAGESNVWKRFAVLPYITDQKYTIGETFHSAKKEGEFIFFTHADDLQQFEKKKTSILCSSICEIICRNNFYLILPGIYDIWINGVKIKRRSILKFGDYVSIGEKDAAEKIKTNTSFLFVAREMRPEAFLHRKTKEMTVADTTLQKPLDDENAVVFTPENVVVFTHILSFLPVQDLKKVRFVSKLWNEESVRVLKKKTIAEFDFMRGYDESNQSMAFFRYGNEMKNCPLPNWVMRLPKFGTGSYGYFDTSANGNAGVKFVQDLTWFLSLKFHAVRTLYLGGTIESHPEFEVRVQILAKLQETLQELNLTGFWNFNQASLNDYSFPSSLIFKRLRKFALCMWLLPTDGSDLDMTIITCLLQPLIHAVDKITSLNLYCNSEMIQAFLHNLGSFSNLDEVWLDDIESDALQLLQINLKNPLRRLRLTELPSPRDLIPLFLKHAKSLQRIQVMMPLKSLQAARLLNNRLPKFPNLTHLSVEWYDDDETNFIVNIGAPSTAVLTPINYEEVFPRLQSLTLGPVAYGSHRIPDVKETWKVNKEMFNFFFAPPQDIADVRMMSNILQELVLTKRARGPDDSIFPRAKELSAMFPNVHNEWMDKARKPSRQQGKVQVNA